MTLEKFFMKRVTGIGDVFIKVKDTKSLAAGTTNTLGFPLEKSFMVLLNGKMESLDG